MDQIQRGAKEMSALIDGLLALSRVSHVEMRREPIPLDALVRAAIERLEPESRNRPIDWRIDPLPRVKCDAELMQQVFVNLIENAVK